MPENANARAGDPGAAAGDLLGEDQAAEDSAPTVNGQAGPLRLVLEQACAEAKCSAGELTVLSVPVDPYRLDTPTGHAEGAWLAAQMERLGLRSKIHLRGLHYALVASGEIAKPNAEPYRNTEADWLWLQSSAAKSARWLGYVDFEQIVDARNEPPIIRLHSVGETEIEIGLGADISIRIPDLEDIKPTIYLHGFTVRQPYHLVFFGEKTSLSAVLDPISKAFDADLYLPAGEISDTMLHTMAKTGADDGRPMIVFVVADFDPSGHQMAVSIGRKLQAFRDLHFSALEFEVHPIALNEDQVRDLGLPSTPLKATEKRADKWRAEFGLEQTEVDALATLRPGELRTICREALAPFYDPDLDREARRICEDWEEEAQEELDAQIDDDLLRQLHAQAEAKIEGIRVEIDTINKQLRAATDTLGLEFSLPTPPEPALPEGVKGKPIISSAWSWVEQTRALKARKAYGNGGEP